MPRDAAYWTSAEGIAEVRRWRAEHAAAPCREPCPAYVACYEAFAPLAAALTESRGEVEAQREKVRSISNLYANERDEAEELAALLGECRNDVLFNALRTSSATSGQLVADIDAALARRKP